MQNLAQDQITVIPLAIKIYNFNDRHFVKQAKPSLLGQSARPKTCAHHIKHSTQIHKVSGSWQLYGFLCILQAYKMDVGAFSGPFTK